MQLLVYVFHPDSTSLLVESFTDFEEAVAACHDLVAVDGYVRAEVWTEAWEQRYGVQRSGGGTLRTYGVVSELEAQAVLPPPAERERALRRATEPMPGARAELAEGNAERPYILGELPERPEQWFGL